MRLNGRCELVRSTPNNRMHLTGYSGLRPLPPAGDAERSASCGSTGSNTRTRYASLGASPVVAEVAKGPVVLRGSRDAPTP